ncbi:hypothetical protein F5884DRAFT_839410 [Xylogone sp. PMI_703]|nr:hypothetical protein F5884DRAFT_839410 [Xylogone sp. PMI_703]
MAKSFPLFPQLPAELRLKIWETSFRKPSIHIFDAFIGSDRIITDEATYQMYKNCVFLDTLNINLGTCNGVFATRFRTDPSVYRVTKALSAACIDSAAYYSPEKKERVLYDNTSDILCLRFGSSSMVHDFVDDPLINDSHPISSTFEGMWSREMAETLCVSWRVAIDISELWYLSKLNIADVEDLAILCSCIHNDLETLYLIDYCVGRCQQCWKGKLIPKELQIKKCDLAKKLDPEDRNMDVVYGAGIIYREIFDFERLGWDSVHPVFKLAQTMNMMIREQQGENGPFHSVRVLVCENEAIDEEDIILSTSCMKNYIM